MSIAAGIDVGSLSTKAVIIKSNKIIGFAIIKSGPKPVESANKVMEQLLNQTGIVQSDIKRAVGTGYGREKITFIDNAISEISCHAKGAQFFVSSARTIIDIGGQDCKVIKLDQDGNIIKFITNDKCASGTGRFLDVMAQVMNIDVSELGKLSQKSTKPISFASICTVWAQADVIKHINSRRPAEDICAGINAAMANRVSMMTNAIKVEKDICMTGGVAKNQGVVKALSSILGCKIKRIKKADPQLIGAIGAALFAQEKI
ncbi:MAG: CoA-substrate-specific enzyme activase [Candidatus Magnetoglobus multicellularis str. Araruama]|uniref:CoA-substrate-specific enzyme activase n=1 Tax=Candidatus Magnetoglobus multicellularis str. Araruama TaxID=890399 RepID=A0A1V1PEQ6_9BACT|nr:MAG: CoA-substrate-specific enzyme activase [Candidatus Magnetoglobus multicellularis str. Araruama]